MPTADIPAAAATAIHVVNAACGAELAKAYITADAIF
jgi:hypothetical protein